MAETQDAESSGPPSAQGLIDTQKVLDYAQQVLAENAALKAENEQLKRTLEKARDKIRALERNVRDLSQVTLLARAKLDEALVDAEALPEPTPYGKGWKPDLAAIERATAQHFRQEDLGQPLKLPHDKTFTPKLTVEEKIARFALAASNSDPIANTVAQPLGPSDPRLPAVSL